ncbi:MAG: hypothetical protein K2G63_04370 [Oscillospiraceae bacterium]|nr:hypothetical protein [Oscillospiraceae bacterium]
MNKILERLYCPLAEEQTQNNPFCTPEINEKYDSFFNMYFSSSVMTGQEYDTASIKFWDFANAVEENAFEVGFYTAVKLLTGVQGAD